MLSIGRLEGSSDFATGACAKYDQLTADRSRRLLNIPFQLDIARIRGVDQKADRCSRREHLMQQLYPLCSQFVRDQSDARRIAGGSVVACDKSGTNRISP